MGQLFESTAILLSSPLYSRRNCAIKLGNLHKVIQLVWTRLQILVFRCKLGHLWGVTWVFNKGVREGGRDGRVGGWSEGGGMDGLVNGWTGGWRSGWTDRRRRGVREQWMNGDVWMKGWLAGQLDGVKNKKWYPWVTSSLDSPHPSTQREQHRSRLGWARAGAQSEPGGGSLEMTSSQAVPGVTGWPQLNRLPSLLLSRLSISSPLIWAPKSCPWHATPWARIGNPTKGRDQTLQVQESHLGAEFTVIYPHLPTGF